jgi:DNA polymerase (family 10)
MPPREDGETDAPEGLRDLLRVPGLGPSRIRAIHETLHLETLRELEEAAMDGRLAQLPGFGARSAGRIRMALMELRATGTPVLWAHAAAEAAAVVAAWERLPHVVDVACAGAIRRGEEVVRELELVVAVSSRTPDLLRALAQAVAATRVEPLGEGGRLQLSSGVSLTVHLVLPDAFALALWKATGSAAHVQQLTRHAAARGWRLEAHHLMDDRGVRIPVPDEPSFYQRLGVPYLPPELRLDAGDTTPAQADASTLVTAGDLQGALHCHSVDSDGSETLAVLAEAAQHAGLRYLGISDHSQSSTYAGGLTRDAIRVQHARIDELNAEYAHRGLDFCLLKGIEADILPCGRLDYDDPLLDAFDFVIGSIHTRFGMNERQMTDRVLRALDDPHLTILGHPTGRLLLTREPYAIDLTEVIGKAAAVGVAIELNADPHRLDLDWRGCRLARELGAQVSIGPDAHAPAGFANLRHGVTQARRGWLAPAHVLNTRAADGVRAFARRRRAFG